MSTEEEIEQAANWVRESGIDVKCILHCTSTYPAEFNQLNLNYIPVLKQNYPDFIMVSADIIGAFQSILLQ